MIDPYQLEQLATSVKIQEENIRDLTMNAITQQLYLSITPEQKIRLTEAYVEGICLAFKSGKIGYDEKIIEFLVENNLIKENLEKLSEEIKASFQFKIETIIGNIDKKNEYADFYQMLKNAINPIIKKHVQSIMEGENKIIINETLRIVSTAFAKISLKNYADQLFIKAQNIINEEIIKEIIE